MIMKKIISCLLLTAVAFACTTEKKWTEEQKIKFKDHIRQIENLAYLHNIDQEQFDLLSENVANSIEVYNPVYTVFIALPSSEDTIKTYVVSDLSFRLDSDSRTLRSLYPYRLLVAEGILEPGLTHQQKNAFYDCFSSKILDRYESMEFFLGALSYGNKAQMEAVKLQKECAEEFNSMPLDEQ